MKINWKRSIIIYAIIILAAITFFTIVLPGTETQPETIPISQMVTMSQKGEIKSIEVSVDTINITGIDGTKYVTTKESGANIYDITGLDLTDVSVDVKPPAGVDWGSILVTVLPLLFVGIFFLFIFNQARGANNQAMSFGRSRARLFSSDKPTVTFEDVAGVEEAKQDLREVVEFLKSREKFQALGARIPKGVLLIGPPGTGKTLLARAVAGEAGVPFFSISGSEFVEMFVGVGASRVRDLFDQAKRNAPCIIFIDEIDAVGRQRGAGLGGGHDEREQTLNQILVEMDGFDTNVSVIVMAATNRPDILDPALLRPGRFDRRVMLDRPDIIGRTAILKVHTKGKPIAPEVDLEVIAKLTAGFSGADLSNLVNESAILAARRNKKIIEMPELEESIDRVLMGPERKSRRMTAKDKEITAYHEAGHALVGHLLKSLEPIRKVTIIPRGMAGGFTKPLVEDKLYHLRSYIEEVLAMDLGGRAAEELIFNEMSTGASQDIKEATDLARRMVTNYGMSDLLGPRTFGQKEEMVFLGREITEQRDYGDKVANQIDDEVNRIIKEAHEMALKVLSENKAKLVQLAKALLEKETLEGPDLDAVFNTPPSDVQPPAEKAIIQTPSASIEEKPKAKTKSKAPGKIPGILPRPKQSPFPS
ncbi:MAG: ATP-dependent zinc metalloprotease FtsH [Dehalococcoidia bacterium]|nr:MAG: ATP-dependent zinc metalloprotease FtsH [Dehalococcoidia bacterium]